MKCFFCVRLKGGFVKKIMRLITTFKLLRMLVILALISTVFANLSCGGSGTAPVVQSGLRLVFADLTVLAEIRCYGLFPWSAEGEIHGGIDLSPTYADLIGTSDTRRVEVIAPASGTIEEFVEHTSGAGATMWSYALAMNDYWYLILAFEPQTLDADVLAEQENSFIAQKGQAVVSGDLLGYLVLGSIMADRYPHIHFGMLYKNPQDTLADIVANIETITRNEGESLPPTTGAGSPWEPQDLGIASQFFCPYVYSNTEAKAAMDGVPRYSATSGTCSCVCAYNSQDGDCGDCP